jgi:L-ribulose-5-phosphate 3-epimerase
MIGIMQGRLLPPSEGRFQAFPANRWRDEFAKARTAGLDVIEWIYDFYHEADNPIGSDEGIAEIQRFSLKSGILVRSMCADYYMQARLIVDCKPSGERLEHLKWLLSRAEKMKLVYVLLPFVDQAAVHTSNERRALRDVLREALRHAEKRGVELHLETNFSPASLAELLNELKHPMLKATYDIGDRASLGFDPREELDAIGSRLGSVHVKDRVLGGGTVPLGVGNADFGCCFELVERHGYGRPYILQVARGNDGFEVSWARQNREFVMRHLTAVGRLER